MVQKILDQLNRGNISPQKRRSLLKRLEKEGIRGQIISLSRNDTKEALAVIEYFERRRCQRLDRTSQARPSSSDIQHWQETLVSNKTPLENKKDALVCLAGQKDSRVFYFFKDYLKQSKGGLKIWSQLAHDELALWQQQVQGTSPILLTKIDSGDRGLDDFNDQLLKFAPHYFCDHLCSFCFRKRKCSFWLENLKRQAGEWEPEAPENESFLDREAFAAGLLFPENEGVQKQQTIAFSERMKSVFRSVLDFTEYFAVLSKKSFWLGPAFEEEVKNLMLYQAVFWEKIVLAISVYQLSQKNKKDLDTAYRAAALAYFVLGFSQVLLGRIAKEAPQSCFTQYLKAVQEIEDGRQAILRQFPLVRRYREKVILNFPY